MNQEQQIADNQEMEDLKKAEENNSVKIPLSRKQRREQERAQVKDAISYQEQLKKSIKRNTQLIEDLTNLYCKSYNDYSSLSNNHNGLKEIRLVWELIPTQASLLELKESSSDLDVEQFMKCLDPINLGAVNLFYLRMDFQMFFDKGFEIKSTLGVPEEIDTRENRKTQLFYHAVFPRPDDLEITELKAHDKLLADFISHTFCSGIDMQHHHNNRMWNKRIQAQSDNLHDKSDEVMKIFEEAAAKKS